ncbi:hypothetical protein FE391_36050 [Nonomuraea sp. KC401]|uniref:hypothetical protein n=1 Tax=unclassified Nonomuraea TaxID=2593643 RepID=UPI0010FD9E28|nr:MULTISPECIES: hypothetical protein [unclassified Nonomuraea]NBE97783.1 hypothetical protein [Nonomuraea sp. K271]TLF58612.1 hypothetical protein FE391_36050 [Nonomuraea sp. KC401]
MPSTPDASHTGHAGHAAWRIAVEASEGLVTAGARPVYALPSFRGSFYLRPAASLAGFALSFPLPSPAPSPGELTWEAVELGAGGSPREVAGQGSLRLGRRLAFAPVSGRCVEVPGGRSGRPYLKIMLVTRLPLALRWPPSAWHRLRPATLRLFTEIRPALER